MKESKVVYNSKEFIESIKKLKKGESIIFDESKRIPKK